MVLRILDPGVILLVSFVFFFVFATGIFALFFYRPGLSGRQRRRWGDGDYEGDAGDGFFGGDGGSDGGGGD